MVGKPFDIESASYKSKSTQKNTPTFLYFEHLMQLRVFSLIPKKKLFLVGGFNLIEKY